MPSTVRRTARLLKDSGRYLLAGVRAALAEPVDATRETLDGWRNGDRELERARVSLTSLLSDAMAEVTVTCAQLGIDLLMEPIDRLPEELELDARRVGAALEATLHGALKEYGQDTTIRVRTLAREDRAVIEVIANRPAALARLLARFEDTTHDLTLAREILRAHGGELLARGDEDDAALVVELPLS